MALTLSEHDLVIAHRPGTSKELLISDMLSRAKSANDPAKLASLTGAGLGMRRHAMHRHKMHLSKEVMSEKSQHRSMQHVVDGAVTHRDGAEQEACQVSAVRWLGQSDQQETENLQQKRCCG